MTDEDQTAARLKGYNCLIKFKDGEELFLSIDFDELYCDVSEWLIDVEKFINGSKDVENIDIPNIAFHRDAIKYVRLI